jgi:hypothetical protein
MGLAMSLSSSYQHKQAAAFWQIAVYFLIVVIELMA